MSYIPQMTKRLLILCIPLFVLALTANDSWGSTRKPDHLSDTLLRYQTNSGIKSRLKKKVYMALLEQEKNSTGGFFMGLGQLRIDFIKPDKRTLIVNNNAVWLETHPPQALGGGIQVTKTTVQKAYQSSGSLLAILFGREHFLAKMKLKDQKTDGELTHYELKPRASFTKSNITKAIISIQTKKQWITEISYWDELENKTTYIFSRIEFDQKYSNDNFNYIPPKGAKITEF